MNIYRILSGAVLKDLTIGTLGLSDTTLIVHAGYGRHHVWGQIRSIPLEFQVAFTEVGNNIALYESLVCAEGIHHGTTFRFGYTP